jgi:hypothetical protein
MPRWRLDWKLRDAFYAYKKVTTVFNTTERARLMRTEVAQETTSLEQAILSVKDPIKRISAHNLGWYLPGEPVGFIASIIGAMIILAVYRAVRSKKV